jgi:RimJ/RimL family protein N-acetyltransferase
VSDESSKRSDVAHDGGFAGLDIKCNTARFSVRTLKPGDVGIAYAEWFEDPVVQRFIAWRPGSDAMRDLREFVADHDARDDSLLLGIFAANGLHVANLKYEPIDLERRTAVLGVLIGQSEWRGQGLFSEVFLATSELLRGRFGITTVLLGVDGANAAALAAYQRVGFVPVPRMEGESLWMECQLP